MDPGGSEVFSIDVDSFSSQLKKENHTLKRALADPHLFAGIGNAYSDEILHRARLSPVALTKQLKEEEVFRLYDYCARCQTGGRLLADRSLSRLLKKSWPRSIDEME